MGKRGPTAKGEYRNKTQVLSTRISADLRAELAAAAKTSGGTLSREIEHRLRRTFSEEKTIEAVFGDRRTYGLMQLINSAVRTTVGRKIISPLTDKQQLKKSIHFLDDPYAFDQAVRTINAVLEAIRPKGEIPQSHDKALDQFGGTFQGEFNAIETLRDIQKAPAALPLPSTKGSRHQHKMSVLKSDIGDLADRAVTRGATADQVRKRSQLAKELGALRRKQARTPDAMTNEDLNRMNALFGEIEKLSSP
jgi:hypothetical protein